MVCMYAFGPWSSWTSWRACNKNKLMSVCVCIYILHASLCFQKPISRNIIEAIEFYNFKFALHIHETNIVYDLYV